MSRLIAYTEFCLEDSTGRRRPVRVGIGSPFKHELGHWATPAVIEAVNPEDFSEFDEATSPFDQLDAGGEGSLHSVAMALYFLNARVKSLVKRGYRPVYEDGEIFDFSSYLPVSPNMTGTNEPPAAA